MNKYLFASLCAVLVTCSVNAQTEKLTNEDVASINQDVETQPSTRRVVKQQIRDWFSKKGITPGFPTKTNKTYYAGTAVAQLTPEDKNFPKSLQQAFDSAYDKARAEFVFDRVGKQISDKEVSTYENQDSDAHKFDPEMCKVSQLESIWNKVVALTGAKLDQALVENGIDPEEFKATPKTAQKDLFFEQTVETIVKTATGELMGLLPVQTFIASDKDGTTRVGIIMVYSPKLVAFAADLRNGAAPSFSAKRGGKPISYFANKPVDELANILGPRLVFNENSQPMILAYGQWASSYHGNNSRQRERSVDLAFEKADMQATQLIGEFVNGQLESKSEQISGSILRTYLETDCKQQRERTESSSIDRIAKYMRITGSTQLKGSAIVREWSQVNEFGVETVGVIRAFSYDLVKAHSQPKTTKKQHKSDVKASVEEVDAEEEW